MRRGTLDDLEITTDISPDSEARSMIGSTTLAGSLSKDIFGFRGVQDACSPSSRGAHASRCQFTNSSDYTARSATAAQTSGGARIQSLGGGESFLRKLRGPPQDWELILYPIAARLGIGDALFLLIANRDSTEESRTTGFTSKQVALAVHQNGSFGCATGQGQG